MTNKGTSDKRDCFASSTRNLKIASQARNDISPGNALKAGMVGIQGTWGGLVKDPPQGLGLFFGLHAAKAIFEGGAQDVGNQDQDQ